MIANDGHDAGRGVFIYCWWDYKLVQPLQKSLCGSFRKPRIDLPQNPAILFLGICQKNCTSYYRDTCSFMSISTLFIVARNWKQSRFLSNDECIMKIWYFSKKGYYSAVT